MKTKILLRTSLIIILVIVFAVAIVLAKSDTDVKDRINSDVSSEDKEKIAREEKSVASTSTESKEEKSPQQNNSEETSIISEDSKNKSNLEIEEINVLEDDRYSITWNSGWVETIELKVHSEDKKEVVAEEFCIQQAQNLFIQTNSERLTSEANLQIISSEDGNGFYYIRIKELNNGIPSGISMFAYYAKEGGYLDYASISCNIPQNKVELILEEVVDIATEYLSTDEKYKELKVDTEKTSLRAGKTLYIWRVYYDYGEITDYSQCGYLAGLEIDAQTGEILSVFMYE